MTSTPDPWALEAEYRKLLGQLKLEPPTTNAPSSVVVKERVWTDRVARRGARGARMIPLVDRAPIAWALLLFALIASCAEPVPTPTAPTATRQHTATQQPAPTQ